MPMAAAFMRIPRTAAEGALLAQAGRLLPCGVRNASVDPDYAMVIREARGGHITDCSGNDYIDYLLGSGPLFLGHAHPAVVEAVRSQLERGTSYLMLSEPAIRLAAEIVRLVPCAEQVSFHNSGSEATFFAIRLARAFRKRDRILKFEGAYHGMHDAALMSTQWLATPVDFPTAVPDSAGIPAHARHETLIAPFNDIEATTAIIERHARDLACVIVEPLHRTIPPRQGFLEELRRITRHFEIPLVFDEVVTGFRLALGGAQERYGVTPDLCALGKTISGGHPFGVVCGRAEIMSVASPARSATGDQAKLTGTFSGNPISCSAALAVIGELERPGLYAAVNAKGRRLRAALEHALDDAGITAQVLGEPTVFQPWFTAGPVENHRDTLRADTRHARRFVDLLLERGIVKGHEKFFLSAAHTDEDIAYTIEAFGHVAAMLGGT
jgi:glutamate-1-semialdehyde 2,1-aminomutase